METTWAEGFQKSYLEGIKASCSPSGLFRLLLPEKWNMTPGGGKAIKQLWEWKLYILERGAKPWKEHNWASTVAIYCLLPGSLLLEINTPIVWSIVLLTHKCVSYFYVNLLPRLPYPYIPTTFLSLFKILLFIHLYCLLDSEPLLHKDYTSCIFFPRDSRVEPQCNGGGSESFLNWIESNWIGLNSFSQLMGKAIYRGLAALQPFLTSAFLLLQW